MGDFATKLADYAAAQIAETVPCKIRTAYDWLSGTSEPADYAQAMILEKLAKLPKVVSKPTAKKSRGRPRTYGA